MINESFFDNGELRLLRSTSRRIEGKVCPTWQGWFNDEQYASGDSVSAVLEELAKQCLSVAAVARDFRRRLEAEAQQEFERILVLYEESKR